MSLQYISDVEGNKTAVVIPIDEWNEMKNKYPDIDESSEDELPQWQKDMLDSRRHLMDDPSQLMSMEDFFKELEEEDANEKV